MSKNQLTKREGFSNYVSKVVNDRCATFLAEPEQRERLTKLVMGLVPKNPKILECTPTSVAAVAGMASSRAPVST